VKARGMKTLFITTIITFLTTTSLFADTLEFKYQEASPGVYKCLNASKQEGLNPGYLGECGQVSGMKFGELTLHLYMPGIQSIGTEYTSPDFSDSYLADCDFSKAKMDGADLGHSLLRRCLFAKAGMARLTVHNSLVGQNSFSGADLRGADFGNCSLKQNRFDFATLTGASFTMSLIEGADFSNADLTQADFADTSLTNVDFRNADLRGADFFDAYVASDVQWRGAQYDETTKLPFDEEVAKEKGMVNWSTPWPLKAPSSAQ